MHRRLFLLARDTRLAVAITILSGLVAGLLTIGQSYVVSTTISNVFLDRQTLAQVWKLLQLFLIIILARGLLTWLNEVAANAVALRVKTDLRQRLFAHILDLGPAYSRGERTGELTTAATEGIEALDAYFSQYLPQLFISTLVPVSILVIVFPIDPLSGIVLLVTAPLIPFFMYLIGRGAEVVTKRQYETLGRLSAHFLDSLQGLTTLKLFGQSKAQTQNIAKVSDQFRETTLKVLRVTFLSAFVLELLSTISTAIIAVEVGLRLLYGQMAFREALFLLILAPEFYLPLRMLGLRFHAGMAGTSAARRIFQILDTPSENGQSGLVGSTQGFVEPVNDSRFSTLQLSNISFTYAGAARPAIQNINLSIIAGEHLALVGASGAGKSTLAHLLLRFINPSSGQFTINRAPFTHIPLENWRSLLTWVPQRPYLFHDTIAANLRFGKPNASDAEIVQAAEAAHLRVFIDSLPEKYETIIGEGGARLSSGQAQRLAFARAFLKDAPILILDEPTSSLDPETETLLDETVRRLTQGRTVLTIAHRLNTVFKADRIVVMDDGHIVETGTHRDLIVKNGTYARMVKVSADSVNENPVLQEPDDIELPPPPTSSYQPSTSSHPPTTNDKSNILPRLLFFFRGSWGWVALSVLLGSLTIGSSVALLGTSAWLISDAALHPSIADLEVAIVGVRFFGIARAVFRYCERLVSHNVTFKLLGHLRVWFFEKIEPLAPARLVEQRAGDLLARIIGDVGTLENFYLRLVAPSMTAICVAVGVSLFLAATDLRLAFVLIGFFILLGLILPILAQRVSRRTGVDVITRRATLHIQLVDSIQGLPDILAFGRGKDWLTQLAVTSDEYRTAQRLMARISAYHSGLGAILTNLAVWLVLFIAIPQVTSVQINGVMLASLALVTLASFEAVTPLPLAVQLWTSTREAARRLFEVADMEPAVGSGYPVMRGRSPVNGESAFVPSIACEDLSFTYPGTGTPAVQHITLNVQPSHSIAIVGPSGAGKSTLANLLLRFWEYDSGEIRLGGEPLHGLSQDEVRERISLVSQNAYFFNASVYENLRFARRKVAREEIESAAHFAQIHDVILGLPRGYDTLIGEQGLRLSAGERQRLAIARAILKDAPILILDEPTVNLDSLTEQHVLELLFELMRRKTSILITHRLIGLEHTDEILVMDHGCIIERGRQFELLQRGGLYRRLWDLQHRFINDGVFSPEPDLLIPSGF